MADQKNQGGQKQSRQQPGRSEQKQGAGVRSGHDKRQDRMHNPDDAARRPTNEQR